MRLVEITGSAKETWHLSKKLLIEIPGIGSKITKEIGNEKYLKFAEYKFLSESSNDFN